jgi:hypothetical protein
MGALEPNGTENPYEPPKARDHVGSLTINPFLTIWTKPRATTRAIVDTNPAFRVLPLAILGGVLEALQLESLVFAGDQLTVPITLLIAIVIGPPLGLVLLYAGAWVVQMSCLLLGGQADSREVRAALAWSSVPLLATLPLWIIRLPLLGRVSAHPALIYPLVATFVPELILSVWWMVITAKALGEVQRFSAWRAFSSMLLLLSPFVILIVILAIVAYFLFTNLLY